MNQRELEKLWAEHDPPLAAGYRFADEVRIKSGEHVGEVGRVVALISVEPTPVYIVEFPSGWSAQVTESELERATLG